MQSPAQRHVLLYLRHSISWHADLDYLQDSFKDPNRMQRLPRWVLRRLSQFMGVSGGQLAIAVSERLEVLRTLAVRILSLARTAVAESVRTEWESLEPALPPGEFSRYIQRERYVSLHLPMHYRRLMNSQLLDWNTASVVQTGNDSLFLCPAQSNPMLHWTEAAVVHALTEPLRAGRSEEEPLANLTYRYVRPNTGWDDPFWQMLLESYGYEGEAIRGESSLRLDLSLDWFTAWSRYPTSRDPNYQVTCYGVSNAVQMFTRAWLPALYMMNPESLIERKEALPYIAFACMEPGASKNRRRLTYEPMDPQDHQRGLRSASRKLRPLLPKIDKALRAIGMDKVAASYAELTPVRVIRALHSRPRRIAPLFAIESYLVEEMLRLAERAREIRHTAASPTATTFVEIQRFASGFVQNLDRKLRQAIGDQGSALVPLLLLAATSPLVAQEANRPPAAMLVESRMRSKVVKLEMRPDAPLAI